MKPKYLVRTLLLLVFIFNTGTAIAIGHWMSVVNEKEKLLGTILLQHDTDPPCWKRSELPEGWRDFFVNYRENPDYIDLGQILPKKRDGRIFFEVSRFNLKQHLHKKRWSDMQIADALRRLENLPEIEFY